MRTLFLAVLLLAGGSAFAATPDTIAIAIDTGTLNPKIATEIRDGIAAQILAGLRENKIDLAPITDADVLGEAVDCAGPPCLEGIARFSRLALIAQVQVRAKKSDRKGKLDYTVAILVARAVPEPQSWRDTSACPGCAPEGVKDVVFLLASTLGERIAADVRKLPPAPAPVQSRPVASARPTPPPATIAKPPLPAREPDWFVPPYLSASVLAGGAVLAGGGVYLLHLNGKGTCDLAAAKKLCTRSYDTKAIGAGLLVGGGLALLGGVAGLVFYGPNTDGSHLALSFTGSSISVSGGF
jgi:hypothetical protein